MKFRTLLGILLVLGIAVWVGGALKWGEWLTLGVMGGIVALAWGWYELRHPQDDPHDLRARETLYVPADWDWPQEDSSSVRHGGLGR